MYLQTIEDICGKLKKDSAEYGAGQLLLMIAKNHPASGEVIAKDLSNEDMSVGTFFEAMKAHARKNAKSGFFCFSPELAVEFAIQFYSLPAESAEEILQATAPEAHRPPEETNDEPINLLDLW